MDLYINLDFCVLIFVSLSIIIFFIPTFKVSFLGFKSEEEIKETL